MPRRVLSYRGLVDTSSTYIKSVSITLEPILSREGRLPITTAQILDQSLVTLPLLVTARRIF